MRNSFFMAMRVPTVTHQEHKVSVVHGKPRFYEPAELKDARQSYMAHLAQYAPHEPWQGPIRLEVKFLYQDESLLSEWTWKTTKPDTDNMIKLLKDCMTRVGFWTDDAQVACEITEKFVVPNRPGIYVYIEEMEVKQ